MELSKNRALDWVPAEYQPQALLAMVLVAFVVFFIACLPKLRVLWRAGPENRLDHWKTRLANTFKVAFLQRKLLKEKKSGWMHALIFWGFLVLLLRAAEFFVIGFFPEVTAPAGLKGVTLGYRLLKDVFVFLVTLATCYALYRRLVLRPKRLTLSGDGLLILALILAIMTSDVLFDAAHFAVHAEAQTLFSPLAFGAAFLLRVLSPEALSPLHNLAYWTHVSSILFFLTLLPRSKHFHILTSIPNVYFSNLAHEGNHLARLDFEDESQESFGVTRIEEFSWKKLLDLHSCTECGRCDDFCPALISGKPLSPKQLTVDLRDHLNRETPWLLNPEKPRMDGAEGMMLGGVIQDETLWSCTTCGACEEECPVMIEYVNKVIDLRRGLVLGEDRYPEEFVQAFKSLETQSNPWGFPRDSRADWAQGLGVSFWDKENPTEYLYFVGCNGAFDSRGKKIAEAVVTALKTAGVDFSILGIDEGCTGDPARRAGNEYLFDLLASKNVETLKQRGVRKIITHCPHCLNSLKNEYPEFGVRFEVVHHSELLAKLIREGKLPANDNSGGRVVFHDSCYLGRHNGVYEPPREVAAGASAEGQVLEVENSRERGTCCGAGGARFLLEEKSGARMSHNRVDELMAAEPDTIAVSCPFCVLMIEDALKAKNLQDRVQVKDISEMTL